MGTVVYFSSRTDAKHAGGVACSGDEETRSGAMPELVQKCALLIGSAISDRIRELGGTDHDVREVALSAAYAVFVSAAADVFGG
jgi:hypothetical protein